MMLRRGLLLLALSTSLSSSAAQAQSATRRIEIASAARLLPGSQQIAVREQWLVRRHELLLPMMRRHEIGMWIVVNEEFHDDPLTQHIAPARPYTGNRDIFVFVDGGEEGLKKFAITGYIEENLGRFFEAPGRATAGAAALKALYDSVAAEDDRPGYRRVARRDPVTGRRFPSVHL